MGFGWQGGEGIILSPATAHLQYLRVVLPMIIGYTVFAYRVFWGKSTTLKY